jgi:hypothetical protein
MCISSLTAVSFFWSEWRHSCWIYPYYYYFINKRPNWCSTHIISSIRRLNLCYLSVSIENYVAFYNRIYIYDINFHWMHELQPNNNNKIVNFMFVGFLFSFNSFFFCIFACFFSYTLFVWQMFWNYWLVIITRARKIVKVFFK